MYKELGVNQLRQMSIREMYSLSNFIHEVIMNYYYHQLPDDKIVIIHQLIKNQLWILSKIIERPGNKYIPVVRLKSLKMLFSNCPVSIECDFQLFDMKAEHSQCLFKLLKLILTEFVQYTTSLLQMINTTPINLQIAEVAGQSITAALNDLGAILSCSLFDVTFLQDTQFLSIKIEVSHDDQPRC